MSSCATHSSFFLKRIVPMHRLGKIAGPTSSAAMMAATKGLHLQDNDSGSIAFDTPEWRAAMCRLYRCLLCLHRVHIPDDTQREFGDRFLQVEFRRAKQLKEPYAIKFYQGWVQYGIQVERGAAQQGRSLTEEQESKLNEEQRGNLSQFRQRAFELRREKPF